MEKKKQCLCPVDPNGDRTCGIPLNLDLLGKGKMNGIVIEGYKKGPSLLRQQRTSKPQSSCINGEVEVEGPEELDSFKVVEDWVKPSVQNKAIIKGSSIRWQDVIPEEVGDFIL